jgi:serine O-acetyltransferase
MMLLGRATRRTIWADLYRYGGDASWRSLARHYVRSPGFRFTYYVRKLAEYRLGRGPFARLGFAYNRIWWGFYRVRFGFDIPSSTLIGDGFYLGHWGGVVISEDAVIGTNVNIGHGVTIGAESRGERTGAPTIGDRVWIGAHAIVVGRVSVGDDALIAPGAFVNFDVPPSSVIVGNPGQIVSDRGSTGYVNHTVP